MPGPVLMGLGFGNEPGLPDGLCDIADCTSFLSEVDTSACQWKMFMPSDNLERPPLHDTYYSPQLRFYILI